MSLLMISLVLSVLVLTATFYFCSNTIVFILFLLLAPVLCILQFVVGYKGHSVQVSINMRLPKSIEWSSKAAVIDFGILIGSVLFYMLCVHFSLLKFVYVFSKYFVFLLPIIHTLLQRKQAYFLTNALFAGSMVIFWTSIVYFKSMTEEIGIDLLKFLLLRDAFLWGMAALVWGILGDRLLRYYKNKSENLS